VGDKDTLFSVVRYGNVAGSRGSIIPFFKSLIKDGEVNVPITDCRMTRFWITLDDAVDLVLKAIDEAKGGELYVKKCPSFKITDLAKALKSDCNFDNIGIRPGEKLHEVMITEEDSRTTVEYDDHYIIYPDLDWWTKIDNKPGGCNVEDRFRYSSDTNNEWLSQEDLKNLLDEIDIVY
jgi:FlaA1/EpsC-like NDP-sugar epimerase